MLLQASDLPVCLRESALFSLELPFKVCSHRFALPSRALGSYFDGGGEDGALAFVNTSKWLFP